ncbi:MAG: hypothetical protein IK094_10130 [Treponema sp.]|nr:hypothetical protein [Treponema sp.]
MGVFLVSSLTLINLLLWLVFLFRFKKLFSADDIMVKFRDGMDGLIREAQHNTLSNINLIDDKIKELKAASAEAERKVAILRHELQTAEKSAALQAQLNMQSAAAAIHAAPKASAKKGRAKSSSKTAKGGSRAAAAYKQNELPGEDEAVALTGLFKENAQKSLFDAPQITVTRDGDSYGKVPIVSMSDEPIKPKKPFARRVRELADLGKTVEEIASATDHSTTEVQLVLDMA